MVPSWNPSVGTGISKISNRLGYFEKGSNLEPFSHQIKEHKSNLLVQSTCPSVCPCPSPCPSLSLSLLVCVHVCVHVWTSEVDIKLFHWAWSSSICLGKVTNELQGSTHLQPSPLSHTVISQTCASTLNFPRGTRDSNSYPHVCIAGTFINWVVLPASLQNFEEVPLRGHLLRL